MNSDMHDSGRRQSFASGAIRDTADDKPRPDLISPLLSNDLASGLGLAPVSMKNATGRKECRSRGVSLHCIDT